jgi:hypothetical protein
VANIIWVGQPHQRQNLEFARVCPTKEDWLPPHGSYRVEFVRVTRGFGIHVFARVAQELTARASHPDI